MPENTEGTAKRTLSSKALAMKNKLIFFALNLVCVLPHVAKRYSHWGAGIAAGMLLVLKKKNASPPFTKNVGFGSRPSLPRSSRREAPIRRQHARQQESAVFRPH